MVSVMKPLCSSCGSSGKRGSPDAYDKEITFETSMGPMVIKAKFALKEMVKEGQPAL
jgi:hypothetical protein